tara:strand:+ start:9451 stop:9639 length:189 start_codon:yes stop_codon:yes gene_type:complete
MKRVVIVFQRATKLTEGLKQMKSPARNSTKVFRFEVEEEEVQLLISELEELNSPFTCKIWDI